MNTFRFTVVGRRLDTDESFVEHVEAVDWRDAINQAGHQQLLDDFDLVSWEAVAVFEGHHQDLSAVTR